MRKSRVLLAGVAVAAAGVTTSAFTAGNTFTAVDNNVAGYGELVATGVAVSNIAYTPAVSDASKLHVVVFTVDQDTSSMSAKMTLALGTTATPASASTCGYALSGGSVHQITCTLAADVPFTAFDKTGLTVVSN
jgi:hypothetical protein